MGNRLSKETNHLELYLNDVYKRECLYEPHVADDEVKFIQTGIETLVQTIADQVLEEVSLQRKMEEVAHKLGIVRETQTCTKIIKVGSFYEGTKNKFPDEFDFILTIGCLNADMVKHVHDFYISSILEAFKTIQEICNTRRHTLVYTGCTCEAARGEQKLFFDQIIHKSTPAENLQFIYQSGSELRQPVHVDLVPAVRCIDPYLHVIRDICNINDFEAFSAEVIQSGNILFISTKFSFTETEVYFMKQVLSQNHKKVYRILKYLINGHGDGAKLEKHLPRLAIFGDETFTFERTIGYSSYLIKTMMIQHHDQCTNTDPEEIGPCILQVLNEMCKYKTIEEFPCVAIEITRFAHEFCLMPNLKPLVKYLESLKDLNGIYDYGKERLQQSVAKQYADDHNFEFDDSDDYF